MAAIEKNKFLSLKKKINEVSGTNNVRLQSLKIPRNLNLSCSKPVKKVFLPNVNVVRNKDKSKEFIKKDEKSKYNPRERKQKNRENSHKFVQSSGVFSDGIGSDALRTSRSGYRGDKENDSNPSISMPTIKKSFKIDKILEDTVLSKITDCDDESDDEKLPFTPISWQNRLQSSILVQNEIKRDAVKVKEEIVDENDETPDLKKLKLESNDHSCNNGANVIPSEFIKQEMYNNDNPYISLWSLPDSFAGKGLSDDPNCKKIFDYGLGDMHEGQIGKILLKKSGKMEICIGSMKYELEPGDSDSYKEDVISLDIPVNKNQIHAATLGNIGNRYYLSPDWDRLLL